MDNEHITSLISLVGAFFLGTTLTGLLLAPLWAMGMARPVQAIIGRARRIAEGGDPGTWPRSAIAEFNTLSADLERMAASLKEREERFLAIFDASPIPIVVSNPSAGYAMVAVNDAWARQFGRDRASVIGRGGLDIRLWQDPQDRESFLAAVASGIANHEVWMLHADGTPILCNLNARQVTIGGKPMIITVTEDITEKRRIEEQLRDLNTRLEERVAQRTEDLYIANAELSAAIERLQITQGELVRSEKLAALGALVAGVAHELNTPIGNGLMALTTLHNEQIEFEKLAKQNLRRSTLDRFLGIVGQGTDIAVRNLTRAAELVTSFKQVAIDRTSAQRREFDLAATVAETIVTLQPTLKRTPYKVTTAVPEGIVMDSYPGPLGQVLTNLLQNAIVHAFDGRDHGSIDIASELIDRVFDPFVTTKMGRGGTGLGLHIAHNNVANLLGGELRVTSSPGAGSSFEMILPLTAPDTIA